VSRLRETSANRACQTFVTHSSRTQRSTKFVLHWRARGCVDEVWQALFGGWVSAKPAQREVNDVVSCPGTDSCKLGITSSMGLNGPC